MPSNNTLNSGSTIPDALSVEQHGRLYNAYREDSEYLEALRTYSHNIAIPDACLVSR